MDGRWVEYFLFTVSWISLDFCHANEMRRTANVKIMRFARWISYHERFLDMSNHLRFDAGVVGRDSLIGSNLFYLFTTDFWEKNHWWKIYWPCVSTSWIENPAAIRGNLHGLANNLSSIIEGNLYDLRVSEIVFFLVCARESEKKTRPDTVGRLETYGPTDGQTRRPTDKRTDGKTHRPTD